MPPQTRIYFWDRFEALRLPAAQERPRTEHRFASSSLPRRRRVRFVQGREQILLETIERRLVGNHVEQRQERVAGVRCEPVGGRRLGSGSFDSGLLGRKDRPNRPPTQRCQQNAQRTEGQPSQRNRQRKRPSNTKPRKHFPPRHSANCATIGFDHVRNPHKKGASEQPVSGIIRIAANHAREGGRGARRPGSRCNGIGGDSSRQLCGTSLKGFRRPAQGCRAAATLGSRQDTL